MLRQAPSLSARRLALPRISPRFLLHNTRSVIPDSPAFTYNRAFFAQSHNFHSTSSNMTEIHQVGTKDGWHGVIEKGGQFEPEKDRYHLYISLFCPFAQRANLVRHLKGLEEILPLSITLPYPRPWQFDVDGKYPGATVDHLFGSTVFSEVYFKDDAEYKGVYSVPVIWDKKTNKIVNNESHEVLRWLPTAFNSLLPNEKAELDFYPEHLKKEIDTLGAMMQRDINHGVYKCGFAKDVPTYQQNIPPLFGALNYVEKLIHKNGGPYVLGKTFTELDIRLFTTIIRFDAVYAQHFKCDLTNIRYGYPVLHNWVKNLYWNHPGFKETTDFKHIKDNYTKSQPDINPLAITPIGPYPHIEEGYEADWTKLRPGGTGYPPAVEYEKKLEQEIVL